VLLCEIRSCVCCTREKLYFNCANAALFCFFPLLIVKLVEVITITYFNEWFWPEASPVNFISSFLLLKKAGKNANIDRNIYRQKVFSRSNDSSAQFQFNAFTSTVNENYTKSIIPISSSEQFS
jgi:hypothetical protein